MKFSDDCFARAYEAVYNTVVKDGIPQKKHCVIFLGGQPGAGKSNFYSQDNNLNGYIVIDGDRYRKFHPDYEDIIKFDTDSYVERTQGFVNECVEHLIEDLSNEGYNLIIEGTLRNPNVPINTCNELSAKGYRTELYVMAVDACTSWKSTINRAHIMLGLDETPRLVPIDKYNNIVNSLPGNIEKIANAKCFDSIVVLDRDNDILYPNKNNTSVRETLESVLNLDEWNANFPQTSEEFIDEKIEVLQETQRRMRVQTIRHKHR
jgi:UDP-N-acetylglucosamine kinase